MDRAVGEVVTYSSIYEVPIVAVHYADGNLISTNTDLLRRYSLTTEAGYSYATDDSVIFELPAQPVDVGDSWSAGDRGFTLAQQLEENSLIVSRWRGESSCIDGWKMGEARILFSNNKGIFNVTNELLDCSTDNIVGYSTSHFSGKVWSPR